MEFPGGRTITPFKDAAKQAFTKTNLFYTKNAFLGIQDPTVLGFKILFYFDNVASPLLFGLSRDINNPPVNSAAYFLKKIGDTQRLYYLEKFIYLLSGINTQCPWYFQSLAGLKDAWKQDLDVPLLKDKKLEIECYDSIDLRITALMDLYRKACFDWKYRREVIPKNLRQFKMDIYLYEQRYISNPNAIALAAGGSNTVTYGYGKDSGEVGRFNAELTSRLIGADETRNDVKTSNVNILEGVPMSTTRNMFHFDFCEFNFTEPGHLETISNKEGGEGITQKFAINYAEVEEENMYNFWTGTDPISDSFVATLDRAAMDDGLNQPAGEPPKTTNRPTVADQLGLPIGPANLGVNTVDLEAEANKLKEQVDKQKDRLIAAGQKALTDAQERAENLVEGATRIPENLFERAGSEAIRAVGSTINDAFLGNIYEGSLSSVVSALTAGDVPALLNQNPFKNNPLQNPSLANDNSSGGGYTGTPDANINQNIAVGSTSLTNYQNHLGGPIDGSQKEGTSLSNVNPGLQSGGQQGGNSLGNVNPGVQNGGQQDGNSLGNINPGITDGAQKSGNSLGNVNPGVQDGGQQGGNSLTNINPGITDGGQKDGDSLNNTDEDGSGAGNIFE